MKALELVEYVARSLVDNPDAVRISETRREQSVYLELHVAPEDTGKIIGREGRVIKAIRALAKIAGAREGVRVNLEVP